MKVKNDINAIIDIGKTGAIYLDSQGVPDGENTITIKAVAKPEKAIQKVNNNNLFLKLFFNNHNKPDKKNIIMQIDIGIILFILKEILYKNVYIFNLKLLN